MSGNQRFAVAGYSDGLWCIVDRTQFLDAPTWPKQVQHHQLLGWATVFRDRGDAERAAETLEQFEAARRQIPF